MPTIPQKNDQKNPSADPVIVALDRTTRRGREILRRWQLRDSQLSRVNDFRFVGGLVPGDESERLLIFATNDNH